VNEVKEIKQSVVNKMCRFLGFWHYLRKARESARKAHGRAAAAREGHKTQKRVKF